MSKRKEEELATQSPARARDQSNYSGPTFASPPHHLRKAFFEFAKDGGRPEDFFAVSNGRLSKQEPYIIIAEFKIPIKKRLDGEYIPCANCRPGSGKFLEGRWIYAPRLRRTFLIGRDCADKSVSAAASREFRNRMTYTAALENLVAILPLLPQMIAALDAARPAATGADRLVAKLRRDAGPLIRTLAATLKQHGEYLIVFDDEVVVQAGRRMNKPIRVGMLPGATLALQVPLAFERQLQHLRVLFNALNDAGEAPTVKERLGRLSVQEVLQMEKALKKSERQALQFLQNIDAIRRFFSPATMRDLQKWGEDPRNTHRTIVTEEQGSWSISDVAGSDVLIPTWPALQNFKMSWPRQPI